MRPLTFTPLPAQAAELQHLRDHHPKAYVREQAAALLKVAAGATVPQVARHGLYKPRRPATVRRWLRRYQEQGAAGLVVQAGRGRPPAFSPSDGRGR